MPIRPRRPARRSVAVVGAALLIAATGGAAAVAVSGHAFGSSTERGNHQPIDDNHPAVAPGRTPGG
jgi:hypothetical protein